MVSRMEALERDIVAYFKSRNEDSNMKSIPVQPPLTQTKPFIASKTQSHCGGVSRSTSFSSSNWRGGSRQHMWTSEHSGTHVDDDNPYLDQCLDPGHHHHHPHHTDDHFREHHSSQGHEQHGDWGHSDNSGYNYDTHLVEENMITQITVVLEASTDLVEANF